VDFSCHMELLNKIPTTFRQGVSVVPHSGFLVDGLNVDVKALVSNDGITPLVP